MSTSVISFLVQYMASFINCETADCETRDATQPRHTWSCVLPNVRHGEPPRRTVPSNDFPPRRRVAATGRQPRDTKGRQRRDVRVKNFTNPNNVTRPDHPSFVDEAKQLIFFYVYFITDHFFVQKFGPIKL